LSAASDWAQRVLTRRNRKAGGPLRAVAGAPKQGQVVAGPAEEIPAAPRSRSPPWNRGIQRSSALFSAGATWLATLRLVAGNTECSIEACCC
jgi:hypothetical protein